MPTLPASKPHVVLRWENDYNQHGAYLVAVFFRHPTKRQLKELFPRWSDKRIIHLLGGGGRVDAEETWYRLIAIDEGVEYKDEEQA
jgi:hypothetical protein